MVFLVKINREMRDKMNNLKKDRSIANLLIFTMSKYISSFGGNVYAFGVGLYILSMTGSAMSFAISMVCSVAPRIIFGPLAGTWADSFSKKKIIVYTQLIQSFSLFGVLFYSITFDFSLLVIYFTTIVLSICSTLSSVTFSSSITNLVNEEHIQRATSLNQSAISFATIGAPVIGGLLYGLFSIENFLLINASTYLISAIIDTNLRFKSVYKSTEDTQGNKSGILERLKEGFSYLRQNDLLYSTILPIAIWVNFFAISMQVGLPYIIVEKMKLSSFQFGIIEGSLAAGMLLMSLVLSTTKEITKPLVVMKASLLFLSVLLMGLILPLIVHLTSFITFIYYVLLVSLFGVSVVFLNTPLYTLMQKTIPDMYKGRVFGLVETIANIISPISIIFYGLLFDYVNSIWVLIGSSVALLLITLIKMSKVSVLDIFISKTNLNKENNAK